MGFCYKIFLEIFEKACLQFIPKINTNNRRKIKAPWLSKELRDMMRVKSDLWHSFLSSGRKSTDIWDNYNKQCKLVKTSMSSSIAKFELELAKNSTKNPKGLFTYIKNKQQVKESIKSLSNNSGNTTTDRGEYLYLTIGLSLCVRMKI